MGRYRGFPEGFYTGVLLQRLDKIFSWSLYTWSRGRSVSDIFSVSSLTEVVQSGGPAKVAAAARDPLRHSYHRRCGTITVERQLLEGNSHMIHIMYLLLCT